MKYFIPLLLCTWCAVAQNEDIQGTYQFKQGNIGGELHLKSDNTYDITMFSGNYTREGNQLTFTSPFQPSFELYKQTAAPQPN